MKVYTYVQPEKIIENNCNIEDYYTKEQIDLLFDETKNQINGKVEELETSVELINNKITYSKNVIVCIAGQSNAVGYDESPWEENFNYRNMDTDRIKQLGFKGDNNLKLINLGCCADSFQDMTVANTTTNGKKGTKGVHLPLANLLLKEIPDDYGIIVIPCAYGGTGFNSGSIGTYDVLNKKPSNGALKWSNTSPYYLAMRDRIKYCLDLNENNLFLGVLWCQGENDSSNAGTHKVAFETMTNDFFSHMNQEGYGSRVKKGSFDKDIWFNMETVAYWYTRGQCQQIWDNYKIWNENTYIGIPRDTDSNAINGTGQTSSNRPSHFGNDAYAKVVAPRVIDAMIKSNSLFNHRVPQDTSVSEGNYYSSGEWEIARPNDLSIPTNNSDMVISLNTDLELILDKIPNYNNGSNIFLPEGTKKIMFKGTRNYYWIIFNSNKSNNVYAVCVGGGHHRKISNVPSPDSLTPAIATASEDVNSSISYNTGDTILFVQSDKGRCEVYLRKQNTDSFALFFAFTPAKLNNLTLANEVIGICTGVSSSEATDRTILFQDLIYVKKV